MKNSFKVKVNDSLEYDLSSLDVEELDIISVSNQKLHLINNNESYNIQILKTDFNNKEYIVKVNANSYKVKISNPLDQLIKQMGFSSGIDKKINDIKAPMPGLILNVNVKPNQQIKEGEVLLILEAMKMENAICAPKDGIVKLVHTKKDNTVEKGELLIEIA